MRAQNMYITIIHMHNKAIGNEVSDTDSLVEDWK